MLTVLRQEKGTNPDRIPPINRTARTRRPSIRTPTSCLRAQSAQPNGSSMWNGIQFGHNDLGRITSSDGECARKKFPGRCLWKRPQHRSDGPWTRAESITTSCRSARQCTGTHLAGADGASLARATNNDLAAHHLRGARTVLRPGDSCHFRIRFCVSRGARAMQLVDLGFRGAMVCTHVNGTDWDDDSSSSPFSKPRRR